MHKLRDASGPDGKRNPMNDKITCTCALCGWHGLFGDLIVGDDRHIHCPECGQDWQQKELRNEVKLG